ncbi:ABC transporter permease subunit [Catellatospora citrea]|uniref:ABC transporter permease n=1 Tax=Catellatospora citrea TaxID=53366 RepID=A0A8J3KFB2_9ACTN|nr:ABC transporter permease subunit [Catellatospora citrea]RKE10475.1 ABC-2 type transport system permease protein [Catellatospora citrea]GIF99016.1 ABC transporter permease [Catellatospora citrea]
MSPLVRKTWRDDRRAIIGWAAGVTAFTAVYTSFYTNFQGAAQLKDDALPEGMKNFLSIQDMTSAAGYLQATVYSLVGPLLVVMCGLLLIARTIPRPEEDGGIELLMVNPLSRRAFAAQRLAATGVTVTAIAAIPWLVVTLMAPAVGIDVPLGNIAAASVGLIALAWCFTGIAFGVGAATGRRSTALAVAGTLAVATYILRGVAGLIDGGAWLRWLSPFHYFIGTDPLHTGWHPGHLIALAAVGVASAVAGIVWFDRRDVGV